MNDKTRDFFSGKRVLVTGAGGYLAASLVRKLEVFDCAIVRISRKNPGDPKEVAGVESFAHFDLTSESAWRKAIQNVDIIYHLAAQTSVYVADQDPLADLKANVIPMTALLSACRQLDSPPVVVFSGTSTQVGLPASLPVSGREKDAPITVYDLHKWMAEQCLMYYGRAGEVRGVSLRLTNVYGPGPPSGSADRGILNWMMRKALNGEPLTIYGKGEYIRDYIYIDDVVGAFLVAAAKSEILNCRHFVIGSGNGWRIGDAVRLIAGRVEKNYRIPVSVRHVKPPGNLLKIEERNFVADIRQFSRKTGWQPEVALQDGIDRTLHSLQKSKSPRHP